MRFSDPGAAQLEENKSLDHTDWSAASKNNDFIQVDVDKHTDNRAPVFHRRALPVFPGTG